MLGFEYDAELAKKVRYEEAREEGLAEGRLAEKFSIAKNLLTTNLPLKEIARVVESSEEKILQIAEKN